MSEGLDQRAKAISKYLRVPPRKARLAAGLIRKLPVEAALLQLKQTPLKAGRMLLKTLESAIANAETQMDMRREALVVQEVRIDPGPTLKRAKPRNKGGRSPVHKRTSHFTVVVGV